MTLPLRLTEHKNLLIVVDLILINVATCIALSIHSKRVGSGIDLAAPLMDRWGLFLLLSILWIISSSINDLYDLSKTSNFVAGVRSLVLTTALVIIAYMAIFFFASPQKSLLRRVALYQGAIGFVLVGGWRLSYAFLMRYQVLSRKVIIVGAGWAGQTIAQVLTRHLSLHYHIVGFVDDDPGKQGRMTPFTEGQRERLWDGVGEEVSFPVLGTREDLRQLVITHQVSEIVLAITHDLHAELVEAILDCQSLGIQITPMPALYERIAGRVPIQHIGDHWEVALPLDHPAAGGFYPILKRAVDILGALIGSVIYAPLVPFIAAAIYIDSRGPIFYRQEREGKGGKVFRLIKFRTMVPVAERSGAVRATERDPRVTRVGKILRKTRLDEFPQLVNILVGDMSAVGPRPERPEHLRELEKQIPFHRMRQAVRPGMAGWAQVNYGYIASVEDARVRLEYDLYYIKHQSLWLDLLIILKMMGQMLRLRGR